MDIIFDIFQKFCLLKYQMMILFANLTGLNLCEINTIYGSFIPQGNPLPGMCISRGRKYMGLFGRYLAKNVVML